LPLLLPLQPLINQYSDSGETPFTPRGVWRCMLYSLQLGRRVCTVNRTWMMLYFFCMTAALDAYQEIKLTFMETKL